ncbi:MAG: metallophosphoesterase [Bacteroidales bacterium]|nr:metallophosphoesterase [Bacteroidales bacterium]
MPQRTILITTLFLFLVTYIYTGFRLYKILPAYLSPRILLIILFVMGIAGMVLFFSFGEKMSTTVSGILYRFSTSWIIAFLYLLIAVLLIDIFRILNNVFHIFDQEISVSIFRENLLTSIIIFGSVGLILIIGNVQYHNKKRQQVSILSSKIEKPIRIVGISDLHIGYTISAKEVSKWVSLINAEKPDIVIIAGDIIDNHLRPIIEDSVSDVLNRINAPMGVYACTGNHDLMFAINEDESFYKNSGITLLRDSFININGITIIGRDDYTNLRREKLDEITQGVDKTSFTILMDHQPTKLNDAVNSGIDFQLSGHTHRGQVFPISLITDAIFELSHGYMKKENTHFYTSSGIGIWGGKFRIGTRSEYLVVDIDPMKRYN